MGRKIYICLLSCLGSLELALLVDLAMVWVGKPLRCSVFLLLLAVLAVGFLWLFHRKRKRMLRIIAWCHGGALALSLLLFLGWNLFSEGSDYRNSDEGKTQFYADQKVMLIVPHQDDEINLMGGVMEAYVHYGSRVYPVFVTNGDCYDQAEVRFAEALAVCEYIGIPQENVTFLGYGDRWAADGPHLYNAQPGTVMNSFKGRTATYGTAVKEAFREGNAYTVDNFLQDLQDVICIVAPDVIYCSDYDDHIDHKATSLAFEKVIGRILKENPDYRPTVYKGYTYNSAWFAEADFDAVNIRSTQNVFEEPGLQFPQIYRWEDRVRMPVQPDTLARSVFRSDVFRTLSLHASQKAWRHGPNVVNGDKVFWKRDTESVTYGAQMIASSGDASFLQDFMLLENNALTDVSHSPFDGVWTPNPEDAEPAIQVKLEKTENLHRIVLYDHPSLQENVLEARIQFPDGTQIRTGPLDPGGAATEVIVEKTQVSEFAVFLEKTEGEAPGLSELEAFTEPTNTDRGFVKLMDASGDFCYDYWTDPSGEAQLCLYTYGFFPKLENGEYKISGDNEVCEVECIDGRILVHCPRGEEVKISIEDAEGLFLDTIYVSNPGMMKRMLCVMYQKLETVACMEFPQDTAISKLVVTARDKLEKFR